MKIPLLATLICAIGIGMSPHSAWAQLAAAPVRDANRSFQQHVTSWKDLKRQSVVMQQRDYSCGAAALATVIQHYWGYDVSELQVLQVIEGFLTPAELKDRIENGITLTDLKRAADKLKYDVAIGKLSLDELAESKIPVIAAITVNGKYEHFVVVRGVRDDWVYLADPIRGNIRIRPEEFENQWIKHAVLVVVKPGQTASSVSTLYLRQNEVDIRAVNEQFIRTRPERILRP